jgi:hypothetical protein
VVEEDLDPVPVGVHESGRQIAPVVPRKGNADTLRLSDGDSEDEHDIDTIERIKDSTGEQVEHESKLLHPDDDDEALSDSEKPSFKSGATIQQDAQKKFEDDVDAILNADHPSKEPEENSNEDEVDAEGPIEESDKAPQRIEALHEMTPWNKDYSFPSWEECESLKEKADALPDMIHVPFEESVRDVRLEGWEDAWISKAIFKGPKLQEPKIDFVYNCEWTARTW